MSKKSFFIYIFLISGFCLSSVYAASYEDGEAAYKKGQVKAAVAIWEELAEEGDLASQLKLAKMYDIGRGVKINKEASFKLYSQAAEQGSLEAQLKLGMFYMDGQGGVKQDKEKARELYRKAAYQGYAKAQYFYGVTYFRGEGVKTDYVMAHAWMRVAEIRGYKNAKDAGDQIKAVLSKSDLKRSKKLTSQILAEIKKSSN